MTYSEHQKKLYIQKIYALVNYRYFYFKIVIATRFYFYNEKCKSKFFSAHSLCIHQGENEIDIIVQSLVNRFITLSGDNIPNFGIE